MTYSDSRSLEQIRRDTERSRAELTQTVGQLRTSVAETAADIRNRIDPDNIKAEVSDYISDRKQRFIDELKTAARNNPMQAVGVGVSLAVPMLRLARAIPLPILMVGAGIFLARSKTGQAVTQRASEFAFDAADEVSRRAAELSQQVRQTADELKNKASDQFGRVSDAVSHTTSSAAETFNRQADAMSKAAVRNTDRVENTAANVSSAILDRAAEMKDTGARVLSGMAGAAQDIASGGLSVARQSVTGAAQAGIDATMDAAKSARDRAATLAQAGMSSAKDSAQDLGRRASQLTDQAGKTLTQTINDNPLLVAGVGLVLGGLIASALPRSGAEDKLIGGAGGAVKDAAKNAVNRGFEAAREAAGEIYGRVARQAEEEGLTPDGLNKAAQGIGDRIRHVADSAVTTAFEPNLQSRNDGAHNG